MPKKKARTKTTFTSWDAAHKYAQRKSPYNFSIVRRGRGWAVLFSGRERKKIQARMERALPRRRNAGVVKALESIPAKLIPKRGGGFRVMVAAKHAKKLNPSEDSTLELARKLGEIWGEGNREESKAQLMSGIRFKAGVDGLEMSSGLKRRIAAAFKRGVAAGKSKFKHHRRHFGVSWK